MSKKADETPDIPRIVGGFTDVRPVAGLANAWHWEAAKGRFHFVLALTSDGRHAVQVNTRDHFDLALATATLAFALKHEQAVLAADPVVLVPGFRSGEHAFEAVVAAAPSIHEVHKAKHPKLHAVTYSVYPAFFCEFSGRETPAEARLRNAKMVDPANLRREPSPVMRIRYVNRVTQGRTLGDQRGLDNPSVLFSELKKLDHAPDSFVEFENYRGEVRKVTWDQRFVLWNGSGTRGINLPELLDWTRQFLLHGANHADAT